MSNKINRLDDYISHIADAAALALEYTEDINKIDFLNDART